MAKKKSNKFSFVNELNTRLTTAVSVTRAGAARIKTTDLRKALEETFNDAARAAASGERVRFPIIGALVRRDVPARKGGKGVNPFTGEPMMIKARPASKKPRWSFPKTLRETFANKKHW